MKAKKLFWLLLIYWGTPHLTSTPVVMPMEDLVHEFNASQDRIEVEWLALDTPPDVIGPRIYWTSLCHLSGVSILQS
jgi:hypothetical protein